MSLNDDTRASIAEGSGRNELIRLLAESQSENVELRRYRDAVIESCVVRHLSCSDDPAKDIHSVISYEILLAVPKLAAAEAALNDIAGTLHGRLKNGTKQFSIIHKATLVPKPEDQP